MLLRFIRFRATVAAAARHFSAESAVGKAIGIGGATARAGGGGDTLGRRLFSLVYAKRSAVIAIGKWKAEGHKVQKYQLNRIVRELRKLKRYKHALEVWFPALLLLSLLTATLFLLVSLINPQEEGQFFIDLIHNVTRLRPMPTTVHVSHLLSKFTQLVGRFFFFSFMESHAGLPSKDLPHLPLPV